MRGEHHICAQCAAYGKLAASQAEFRTAMSQAAGSVPPQQQHRKK